MSIQQTPSKSNSLLASPLSKKRSPYHRTSTHATPRNSRTSESRSQIDGIKGSSRATPIRGVKIKLVNGYVSKDKERRLATPKLERVKTSDFLESLSPKKEIPADLKVIADAIYELSTDRGNINSVIDSVIKLSKTIDYKSYNHDNIAAISFPASECPPDVLLYILSIAAAMVTNGNRPTRKQQEVLIELGKDLLTTKKQYQTFEDQSFPKKRAEEILNIFKSLEYDYKINNVTKYLDMKYEKRPLAFSTPKEGVFIADVPIEDMSLDEVKQIGEINKQCLTEEDLREYEKIRDKWFLKWETAFQGVHYIWDHSLEDKSFSLAIMLSIIDDEFVGFAFIGINNIIKNSINK